MATHRQFQTSKEEEDEKMFLECDIDIKEEVLDTDIKLETVCADDIEVTIKQEYVKPKQENFEENFAHIKKEPDEFSDDPLNIDSDGILFGQINKFDLPWEPTDNEICDAPFSSYSSYTINSGSSRSTQSYAEIMGDPQSSIDHNDHNYSKTEITTPHVDKLIKRFRNTQGTRKRSGKYNINWKGTKFTHRIPRYIDCNSCRYRCTHKFSKERQLALCKEYWALSNCAHQRNFICTLVTESNVKRSKSSIKPCKIIRTKFRVYYLPDESKENRRVCLRFFCATFAISFTTIDFALKCRGGNGAYICDRRKRRITPNTKSLLQNDKVKEHIDSFTRIKSHYCRHFQKLYLRSDLSVSKMYQLYKHYFCAKLNITPVNKFLYNLIFESYDPVLSFNDPEKDQCSECNKYNENDYQKQKRTNNSTQVKSIEDNESEVQTVDIPFPGPNHNIEENGIHIEPHNKDFFGTTETDEPVMVIVEFLDEIEHTKFEDSGNVFEQVTEYDLPWNPNDNNNKIADVPLSPDTSYTPNLGSSSSTQSNDEIISDPQGSIDHYDHNYSKTKINTPHVAKTEEQIGNTHTAHVAKTEKHIRNSLIPKTKINTPHVAKTEEHIENTQILETEINTPHVAKTVEHIINTQDTKTLSERSNNLHWKFHHKTPQYVDCKKCRFHCSNIFSEERRLALRQKYWTIPHPVIKRNFICSLVSKSVIHQKIGKRVYYYYYLPDESKVNHRVCLNFFCGTFAFTFKVIAYALQFREANLCKPRSAPIAKTKLQINPVKEQIDKFPSIKSQKLHLADTYKSIFMKNEPALSCDVPKKDRCSKRNKHNEDDEKDDQKHKKIKHDAVQIKLDDKNKPIEDNAQKKKCGWYVVRFIDEDDVVDILPANWLKNSDECVWPPYTRRKLQYAIKNREKYNHTWESHKIKLITDKLFTKFVVASSMATKAKYSLDLSTEEKCLPEKRKRRKVHRSSSSEEDNFSNDNENIPLSSRIRPTETLENLSTATTAEECLPGKRKRRKVHRSSSSEEDNFSNNNENISLSTPIPPTEKLEKTTAKECLPEKRKRRKVCRSSTSEEDNSSNVNTPHSSHIPPTETLENLSTETKAEECKRRKVYKSSSSEENNFSNENANIPFSSPLPPSETLERSVTLSKRKNSQKQNIRVESSPLVVTKDEDTDRVPQYRPVNHSNGDMALKNNYLEGNSPSNNFCAENSSALNNKMFQEQVMRQLAAIEIRLNENTNLIQLLHNKFELAQLQNIHINNEDDGCPDFIKQIPIRTEEQLEDVETLIQNHNICSYLVNHLARLGGETVREHIRRILCKLLDDNLAHQYSWVGHKGKKKFNNLKLATVVTKAVQRKSPNESDKSIEMQVALWLTKASERLKRKNV